MNHQVFKRLKFLTEQVLALGKIKDLHVFVTYFWLSLIYFWRNVYWAMICVRIPKGSEKRNGKMAFSPVSDMDLQRMNLPKNLIVLDFLKFSVNGHSKSITQFCGWAMPADQSM